MVTIEVLEKQLKEKQLNSMYLLYGEERYLLESIVKKIKALFGEMVKGINYIEIDDTNIKELISDIETPAFGFEKKLIFIKNTGIFKREVKKRGLEVANMKEKLQEYLLKNKEEIQQTVVIVFIEESVDKGKLLSAVEEMQATICNFEALKPVQIIARLKGICKAYHVTIADNTAKYFIETVGTNMQEVINEIRKQIEYVGNNGTITKETIDALATKKIEAVIFDLTDRLGNRNIQEALQTLHDLIYAKEPVQKILITLYNHFKKLYLVKLATRKNLNITEVLKLKPNQMFLTTKYKTQSEYFKEQELKNILQELINLDSHYKVGLIDLNLGLEAILCRYCS